MSRIPFVKCYQVIGYLIDGRVLCPYHARDLYWGLDLDSTESTGLDGNPVVAIFAGSEYTYYCDVCFYVLGQ